MANALLYFAVCGVLVFLLALRWCVRRASDLPLPPGPPTLPLIGNLLVMPPSHAWVTYHDWAKKYGDIIHLDVLGQSLILLSSLESARELLESQSAKTSGRPHFTMISDLMGWDWAVQFMTNGPRFRRSRKVVAQNLLPASVKTFTPWIEQGSRDLVRAMLDKPSEFMDHLKHHSGGLMMSILYGEEPGHLRDQYVKTADEAIDGLVQAGNIGEFLVDFVPVLRFIPAWVPGAGFQKKAREWRRLAREMIEVPFCNSKTALLAGSAQPSVARTLLEQNDPKLDQTRIVPHSESEEEVKMGALGVMYVGGADTSLSVLDSLMLAMTLYPEIQKRAHDELDAVIGRDRLPVYCDRPSLPYFDCIFSEIFRWQPGVPLGVPHRVTEDCVLNGYRIPAGALVLVNQWSILHNETLWSEPAAFRPERFLPGNKVPFDPREASFGFGRRVCPGRHFADALLWMLMVRIVASFDISKGLDQNGRVVEPSGEYTSGMVSRPTPFSCTITPRLQNIEALLSGGS